MTKYTLGRVLPGLVKPIHIELSNKRVDFGVSEVSGKYKLFKLVDVLDHEFKTRGRPKNDFIEVRILR